VFCQSFMPRFPYISHAQSLIPRFPCVQHALYGSKNGVLTALLRRGMTTLPRRIRWYHYSALPTTYSAPSPRFQPRSPIHHALISTLSAAILGLAIFTLGVGLQLGEGE
jgi:hypothetical protein